MQAARLATNQASQGFDDDELTVFFAAMDKLISNLSHS